MSKNLKCHPWNKKVTNNTPQSPVTREMMPVLPRNKIHFDFNSLGANAPPDESLGDCDFGLMLIGVKHITIENISISHAVVVVGASDVGVAAVQKLGTSLFFVSNLYFQICYFD